jgi:RNA polymerase sigma-70 factor (ECF subfamily)
MNENELVAKLRQRDPRALQYFHTQYHDRIFSVARRLVRDDWDAEEVVQDVYWTVHRKIDLFNGTSAFWSWCFRVTENAAKMKIRKYKRYPTPVENDTLAALSHDSSPDDLGSRPDRQLAYKETLASIEEFLASSDEMNRQVYMLMDVVGMEKEEVAEKLDLTIPALKARLHRIRYALREHLGSAA